MTAEERCDFCYAKGSRWVYYTTPFTLPEEGDLMEYIDDGEWAACNDCMLNIEDHAEEAIVQRLIANARREISARPSEQDGLVRWAQRLMGAFRANLIGGPTADA